MYLTMSDKAEKRILLVEDDALLVQVLIHALKEDKFDILNIANGLKVLDAAKKFEPAAILLDLILPGLDGFAVLKQLKEDEKTKHIPVVVISNLGEAADVKSALALGAEEYFIKANTQLEKIINFVKKIIKD